MSEVMLPPDEDQKDKQELLALYATATKTKVLSSPNDLDSKDKVMEEMFAWCKEQGDIIVLKSGTILSSNPTSRAVQNCKSLMLSKGMHPGQVYASTEALLGLM